MYYACIAAGTPLPAFTSKKKKRADREELQKEQEATVEM
jgi:hypothetical protein